MKAFLVFLVLGVLTFGLIFFIHKRCASCQGATMVTPVPPVAKPSNACDKIAALAVQAGAAAGAGALGGPPTVGAQVGGAADKLGAPNLICKGLAAAEHAIVGAAKDVGKGVAKAATVTGHAVVKAATATEHAVATATKTAIIHPAQAVVHATSVVAKSTAKAAKAAEKKAVNTVKGAAKSVGHAVSSVGHALSHLF